MFGTMLASSPNQSFGYEADVFISAVAFAATGSLWKLAHVWCDSKLPGWKNFSQDLRDRMCVEMAVLPTRCSLAYFSFSIVLTAFTAPESWEASDTKNSLIACSLMTGAYLFDLSIHRDDILSIIHHCMGPALLLWIRSSFSSFDSSDALLCRPLMMFVFFGAGIGGAAASCAVFLLRVGKSYMSSEKLYRHFAPCLVALTVSTVLSCYLNTWYLLHTYNCLYGYFGAAYILPVTWEGFECYLQWRWLFRFYEFEKKFWIEGKESGISNSGSPSLETMTSIQSSKTAGLSVFPSCTVPILKSLTLVWSVMLAVVVFKLSYSLYQDHGELFIGSPAPEEYVRRVWNITGIKEL